MPKMTMDGGVVLFRGAIFICFLFVSMRGWAEDQVVQKSGKDLIASYSKEIQDSLKRLRDLSAENYYKDIDSFRTDLEKYFEHKKRVCDGEFSTVILSELKSSKKKASKKKIKLSNDERKLCFRELKALQVTFVNNMYVARKRYLEFLHQNRLKELTQAREDSIKSIRASFDKK